MIARNEPPPDPLDDQDGNREAGISIAIMGPSALTFVASANRPRSPDIRNPRAFNHNNEILGCEFKIHREDEVRVTSTLFCGGDWRWQLCSSGGHVLAQAGGFASERECCEAIAMLKNNAATAIVTVSK